PMPASIVLTGMWLEGVVRFCLFSENRHRRPPVLYGTPLRVPRGRWLHPWMPTGASPHRDPVAVERHERAGGLDERTGGHAPAHRSNPLPGSSMPSGTSIEAHGCAPWPP